jgi:hypothetical protein
VSLRGGAHDAVCGKSELREITVLGSSASRQHGDLRRNRSPDGRGLTGLGSSAENNLPLTVQLSSRASNGGG